MEKSPFEKSMELVCPAGNLPALKAAVDNGADSVYLGFKDETNARHFPGLNFSAKNISKAVDYAHKKDAKALVAINTFPQPAKWKVWEDAVNLAANSGADAIIVADIGVLDYATNKYPNLNRHLSVQGSASSVESLKFYIDNFGISRAVLPRVLTIEQIKEVCSNVAIDIEVFGFGSLCVMAEGRCMLSSYATGQSPNTYGACSPASHVKWQENGDALECRLNDILLDSYKKDENAAYPTPCKGRYNINGETSYAFETPISLNTVGVLDQLIAAGAKALKIEGRQRSPAYVAKVTQAWRLAIDCISKDPNSIPEQTITELNSITEGVDSTTGPYQKGWR